MKKIVMIVFLIGITFFPKNTMAQNIEDYTQFNSFMKRYHEHTVELTYYLSTAYQSNEHYFNENMELFRNVINNTFDTHENEFVNAYLDSFGELLSKPIALLATADDLRSLIFNKIKDFFSSEQVQDLGVINDKKYFYAPDGYLFKVQFTRNNILETHYPKYIYLRDIDNRLTFYGYTNGSLIYQLHDFDTYTEDRTYFDRLLNQLSQDGVFVLSDLLQYANYKDVLITLVDSATMTQESSFIGNNSPIELTNLVNNVINNFNSESLPSELLDYEPTIQPMLVCPNNTIPLKYENGTFLTMDNEVIVLTENEQSNYLSELCNLDFGFPKIEFDSDTNEVLIDGENIETVTQMPECDGILCWVSNIFKSIASIPMKIVNGLLSGVLDLMKTLFVPSSDSFNVFINELNTTMSEKFNLTAFTTVFNEMTPNSNARSVGPAMTNAFDGVTVSGLMGTGEVKIIDSTTINAMLPTIHSWIKGFFYVLLAFFNINHLYKLIRGTTIFESMRGKNE